ncbi:MAG: hypothetical protein C0516_11150 [Gemmatimonas sp.]|nr:hypothetical protein [Gemmatimonas sp.]
MPFFAVINDGDLRVRRIDLTPALTSELEGRFSRLATSIFSSEIDRIPFSSGYRPDESEIAVIEPFQEVAPVLLAVRDPISIPSLVSSEIEQITFIAVTTPQAEDVVCLQSFDKRQLLARRGLALILSGTTFSRLENPGLTIRDEVDAVVHPTSLRIEFSKLTAMRRMFDMTEHYREATKPEISQLALVPSLRFDVDELHQRADSWTRRKISSILQNGVLQQAPVETIIAKAEEVGLRLTVSADGNGNAQILLPGDTKSLKALLRFLDDDYLSSLITPDRYVTNSKRRIGQ